MKQTNVIPAEFSEMLSQAKRDNNYQQRFLAFAEKLSIQLSHACICGSWVQTDGSNTLIISIAPEGFSLMMCDSARCYKQVKHELTATMQGHRVMLCDDAGNVTLDDDGVLYCGRWGTFRREEDLLREEMHDELEFALRSCNRGEL